MKVTSIIILVLILFATTFYSLLNAKEQSNTLCRCLSTENGHQFPVVDSLWMDQQDLLIQFKPHAQPLSIVVDRTREIRECKQINACKIRISQQQLKQAKTMQVLGLGHLLQTLQIPQ